MMAKPAARAALTVGLLAAWSAALAQVATPQTTKTITCAVAGSPTRAEAARALALRRTIEASPLYALPTAAEGLAACHIHYQANGVLVLEYHFRGDGTLTVTRDERIKYLEQDASLVLPTDEAAEMLLVGAEQAAFGTRGCGIDWRQPHKRIPEDNPAVVDTIYRGDVCNCQARVRRGPEGNVIRLLFRSAC